MSILSVNYAMMCSHENMLQSQTKRPIAGPHSYTYKYIVKCKCKHTDTHKHKCKYIIKRSAFFLYKASTASIVSTIDI